MKLNSSLVGGPMLWPHLLTILGGTVKMLARGFVSIRLAGARALTRMQVGRMQSVLQELSDAQLKQIGIDRSGIREHAEYLVNYEYDGL
ncbi:hypothetical protein PH5382_03088 [Phaeobacter sp. CECT 5382]|uniref:hypothetical protein n=1 Tax=Rhodobacterales TaxID=204455 RepID=UPI0006D9E0EF|nr:hypothetical protein [Phaeobacter sp. CECT 5382]CUH89142.1 hypothetical protein PH5382_03088 [Phaeobacter sp. CECT 5382]